MCFNDFSEFRFFHSSVFDIAFFFPSEETEEGTIFFLNSSKSQFVLLVQALLHIMGRFFGVNNIFKIKRHKEKSKPKKIFLFETKTRSQGKFISLLTLNTPPNFHGKKLSHKYLSVCNQQTISSLSCLLPSSSPNLKDSYKIKTASSSVPIQKLL